MTDYEPNYARILAHLIVATTELLLMVVLNNRFSLGLSLSDLFLIFIFIKLLFR